jgi:hypothetical protein
MFSPFRSIAELASLFRYWLRQPRSARHRGPFPALATRQPPAAHPVIVPWVGGTSLVIETGMTGATMNFYCGLHEAADMAFVLHSLRPGDSQWRCPGPHACPRTHPRLAVGATEESVRFTAGRDTTNRAVSLLPSPSQELIVEVPLTSLDQLLQ